MISAWKDVEIFKPMSCHRNTDTNLQTKEACNCVYRLISAIHNILHIIVHNKLCYFQLISLRVDIKSQNIAQIQLVHSITERNSSNLPAARLFVRPIHHLTIYTIKGTSKLEEEIALPLIKSALQFNFWMLI